MKENLRDLIAKGKTKKAIQQLSHWAKKFGDEDLQEEVLLQAARFQVYQKGKRQAFTTYEEQQVGFASINQAVLQIINDLPEDVEGVISENTFSKRMKRPWVVGMIVLAVGAVLASLFGRNLFSLSPTVSGGPPLQLTVYVHGPKGKQDIVLDREGTVVLDLGNDRRVAEIGEHGRTNFGEIGRRFIGEKIPLSILADNWVMAHPDTAFIYNGQPIYLKVKSDCQFCSLRGNVQSSDGNLVGGLRILIKGMTLVDTTDQMGYFHITIPPELERKEYIVSVVRDEKIVWENYVTPNPDIPVEILLPQ